LNTFSLENSNIGFFDVSVKLGKDELDQAQRGWEDRLPNALILILKKEFWQTMVHSFFTSR